MTDIEPARVRPFADWLREQRSGRTHEELSEQLHALVEAVAVEIKPMSAGDPNTLVVADKVLYAGLDGEQVREACGTTQQQTPTGGQGRSR